MPGWRWTSAATQAPSSGAEADGGDDDHLQRAQRSLQDLLEDPSVPTAVREQLADDYRQIEAMCDKLARGDLHIAAFGKVSVGKSSLLNALLGEDRFATGPTHGVTRGTELQRWRELDDAGQAMVIDTPGIDEVDGQELERMAHEVAGRSDLVIFVVDGDLTDTEYRALRRLTDERRPLLLALNKADRFTADERTQVLERLRERSAGLVAPENVVAVSSDPDARIYIEVQADGSEREVPRRSEPDLEPLTERIWSVLEHEGKTLAALNAGLFAARLSDQVAERITEIRRELAERVVRTYCIGKAVAVALNPVPVADVLGAAALDVTMVVHLGRVYGLPVTRAEAGRVLATIAAQLAALMGTVWSVNLASSALKGLSLGLTVGITAGAQGALAYYATYLVGRAAERYLAQGKSWGELGPKRLVVDILDSVDRSSVLAEARRELRWRLRRA